MFIPLLALVGAYACYKVILYRRTNARLSNWPGKIVLFHPFHPIGALYSWYIGQEGRDKLFVNKRLRYEKSGWNIVTSGFIWPQFTQLAVADADVVKQITHDHPAFPKPTRMYRGLTRYGENIVTTEGEDWKKHRRIAAPAFSEKNNKLVWDVTVSALSSLLDDVWGVKDRVEIDQVVHVTTHLALMVLSEAGFGIPLSWQRDEKPPPGHKLTFTQTLEAQNKTRIIRRILPRFIGKRFKCTELAYACEEEMKIYLSEIILERQKAADKEDRSDLLTNLIKGSDEGTQGYPALTVSELMGNVFVFLIAGHETTAHTLAYVFLLLAVYQEEQDKLYQHIKDVVGDREPTYDDHIKLTRVLAVFYEALRLYPIVLGIPKKTAEDVVFTATRADPNDPTIAQLHVPKGTVIALDIPAIHYNPRHWPNPNVFNPERFLGEWNRDALVAFSGGLRACIGRRFSETEGVAAITTILSRYKVTLVDQAACQPLSGETLEQRRLRLIKSDSASFTLTPQPTPLLFTRR